MIEITQVHGREILDSRGNPTVEACNRASVVAYCSVFSSFFPSLSGVKTLPSHQEPNEALAVLWHDEARTEKSLDDRD